MRVAMVILLPEVHEKPPRASNAKRLSAGFIPDSPVLVSFVQHQIKKAAKEGGFADLAIAPKAALAMLQT